MTLLSPEQRRLRRRLRNELAKKRVRARRVEAGKPKYKPVAKLTKCAARTKKGEPCKAYALAGSDVCLAHQNKETKQELGIGLSKRVPKVTAPTLMRQVVEAAVDEMLKPYLSAVGLELVGFDEDTNEVIVQRIPGMAGKGLLVHGESRDGDIVISDYPDLAAQITAVEKLLDRVYGKPRITTVIEGGVKPIRVEPVRTEQRAREVAELLARSGALPPVGPAPEGQVVVMQGTAADAVPAAQRGDTDGGGDGQLPE